MRRWLWLGLMLVSSTAYGKRPMPVPVPAPVPAPSPAPAPPPGPGRWVKPLPVDAAPLVGLREVAAFAPAPGAGYIDDAIAVQGNRLAYVAIDPAGAAQVQVVDVATGAVVRTVPLAGVTAQPTRMTWFGERLWVEWDEAGGRAAAMFAPDGKLAYRVAPANRFLRLDDGRLAVVRISADATRWTVETLRAPTGKRQGKVVTWNLVNGSLPKFDFTINHWSGQGRYAHGIRGGVQRKKNDARSPDEEAVWDLATGKFLRAAPIADLREQRKRFEWLRDAGDDARLVRLSAEFDLEWWGAERREVIELDQPVFLYEFSTLQVVDDGGGRWLALHVDPVNPPAVKRQKADPEYFTLFQLEGTKAIRRGQIYAKGKRFRFGLVGDRVWVLERHVGADRGGPALRIYAVE